MERVTRIELAVEVAPIDASTVQRLKAAGFDVYQGKQSWRVVARTDPSDKEPLFTQAINLVNDILIDFRLDPLHHPPAVTLRYEGGEVERAMGELILEDARRANDPDPLQIMRRKWWQKQMELGLGERKGD